MSTERQAVFTVGPSFFREKGKIMFQFVIDGGNIVGPQEATSADIEKYPEAYANMAYANMAEAEAVDEPEELEKTTLHPKTAPKSEPKKPAPWMKKK